MASSSVLATAALDDVTTTLTSGDDAPPGACLGVSSSGHVTWSASGSAQTHDDDGQLRCPHPMSAATRSDLGSVTKVVATTTALMAAADAGDLDLDLQVAAILPEARNTSVATASVRDLLQHRAGLWEWWPLYVQASTPERALETALSLPLRYAMGTGRHYSDLGFQILGAIVARLAGKPLAETVQTEVLTRLGLVETRYAAPVPGGNVAASSKGDAIEIEMIRTGQPYPVAATVTDFLSWRHHVLVGEVNDGNAFHAFSGVAGHAGLFATAADLIRYGDAMAACLAGNGPIAASTVRTFMTVGPDPVQALGFRRWRSGHDGCTVDAYGHTGFPGVAVVIIPDHQATVALVTNRLHTRGTPRATEGMLDLALAASHRMLHA